MRLLPKLGSAGFVGRSVEADASKISELNAPLGLVIHCLKVDYTSMSWCVDGSIATGIHGIGPLTSRGWLQLGDQQEPGCSRDAGEKPGPRSRGNGGRRRLAPAGAVPT